jgi:hypothetical protein
MAMAFIRKLYEVEWEAKDKKLNKGARPTYYTFGHRMNRTEKSKIQTPFCTRGLTETETGWESSASVTH